MTQNNLKCYKTVQYGQTSTKMAQNDIKWSKMVGHGPRMMRNDPNFPKVLELLQNDQNGFEWSQNGPKWPEIV
jgi:hypothetical protein